ncbi:putative vacuolar protein sorting-associated protein TDA6-like protein 2 [Colletotrichum chlorophyti]|uniref:N-acetylglucosaminylphosphatidylinositol deacetylase n=1 Tax=Colletotrichum chlorophyti TaxID=708187 RepID=A0A1Q8S230_9PEZI|nr:putative vacuolar protein sorting-associated protein TDA6-like protein 2 [Colletotrichum chlorophyti]
MSPKNVRRAFRQFCLWVKALHTRRRIIIRLAVIAILVPIVLQWALAYPLGGDARLLPYELQSAKNILIVTAHPDDECLFFAPSILAVLGRNHHLTGGLLAMSVGNNKGIGDTRKQELKGSCHALGIDPLRCEALDHPDLQDNPKLWWSASAIQPILKDYVRKWKIDAIITFDEYGVSGHINHRAVSAAVSEYVANDSTAPVAYKLVSTALARKYTFILDLPFTAVAFIWRITAAIFFPSTKMDQSYSTKALMVNTWGRYMKTRHAFASHGNLDRQRADEIWIDSSPYWFDRQACRWLSLCGVHHLAWDPPTLPQGALNDPGERAPFNLELRSSNNDKGPHSGWQDALKNPSPEDCNGEGRYANKAIPDYVLQYAPLVYLHSKENFWPADIAEHIRHMNPHRDDSPLNQSMSLTDLHTLNQNHGRVFLTSKDNVELRPEWLHSHMGIPEPWERDEISETTTSSLKKDPTWSDVSRQHWLHRISDPRRFSWSSASTRPSANQNMVRRHQEKPVGGTSTDEPKQGGRSEAPAHLVIVEKGSGIVDAFWFFFYSYNLGQTVLSMRFGNHVGDWEHCVVRFQHGKPRAVFLSEHAAGQAYTYDALEKRGARPVLYSAIGSHAMYPGPGDHPYVLPFKMLKDETDRGPLWDPAKNIYSYWYDYPKHSGKNSSNLGVEAAERRCSETSEGFIPTTENPNAPTSWLRYVGAWGDNIYPLADGRQWRLFNQYHYDEGPYGPKLKRLDREEICITDRCQILEAITPGQTWYK